MAVVGSNGPGSDPALLRRLFEAVPDGLWLFDDEGVTIWANDATARILGRTSPATSRT
jgi:two-component system sensor histidine kinase/response regulator